MNTTLCGDRHNAVRSHTTSPVTGHSTISWTHAEVQPHWRQKGNQHVLMCWFHVWSRVSQHKEAVTAQCISNAPLGSFGEITSYVRNNPAQVSPHTDTRNASLPVPLLSICLQVGPPRESLSSPDDSETLPTLYALRTPIHTQRERLRQTERERESKRDGDRVRQDRDGESGRQRQTE